MAIIRISGYPGSGKSTLGRRLARKLNYRHLSMGDVFRKTAQQRGLSVERFYAALVSNPNFEKELDAWMIDLLSRQDNIVIDGRMAPFYPTPFIKINILLVVDHRESARRLIRRPEYNAFSVREMLGNSRKRVAAERAHYRRLYGLANHLHPRYFDIVINTTKREPEQVLSMVLKKLRSLSSRAATRRKNI